MQDELNRVLVENNKLQQKINSSDTMANVCKVAIKLPPFWTNKPAVWFGQIEAQFTIAGITSDSTMFDYVVAHLDQKLAGEVEDIITKPPPKGQRYAKLKEELTRRLSMSDEQRLRQLISEEELGDRRPSQFLRYLRSLASVSLSDDILRQLWLQRLPQQVQAILVSQSELSLDKLADLADKVFEFTGTKQVSACVDTTPTTLDKLILRVEELGRQVATLSTNHRSSRSHSRTSAGRRSRTTTPANKSKLCWYHKKFDVKASKCIKPCSWMSSHQGNENHSQ